LHYAYESLNYRKDEGNVLYIVNSLLNWKNKKNLLNQEIDEIRRGNSIARNRFISENSNFSKIKRKDNMYIGQQIYFDKSDVIISEPKKFKYISYTVACFFIFFVTYFMIFINGEDKISSQVNDVYAIVELESNIQNGNLNFEIDENGKIVSQNEGRENEDKNLESTDIIKSYLEDLIDDYPIEDRILIISSSLYDADDKVSKKGLELSVENIKIIVNEYLEDLSYVRYVELSEEERLKAEEHNLSMAKYYGYMLKNDSKKTVNLEDANDLTVKDYYNDNSENNINNWERGVYYKIDDKVLYEGIICVCVNNHISQNDYAPDKSASLWRNESSESIIPSDSELNPENTIILPLDKSDNSDFFTFFLKYKKEFFVLRRINKFIRL
jgi:hypothetical protein